MNKKSGKPYRQPISALLNDNKPDRILDLACGSGWVGEALSYSAAIDGTDLYAPKPEKYQNFIKADFNGGVPESLGVYGCIVCCEAMRKLPRQVNS